jgi:transposase
MIRRFELTDIEWEILQPILPADPARGGKWKDHRTVISGILWRDLPARFGTWKTVYQRKRRWAMDGTWARIAEALRLDADTAEGRDPTTGATQFVY